MAGAIRKKITQMAKMFITGESPEDALPALRKARENSLCFTVDILGEATLSEKEALEYQSRYVDLINWLCKDSANWRDNEQIDRDDKGAIPKVNVSVKLTALYSQVSDKAWDVTVRALKDRLRPIFALARDRQVFVNLDMEQYKYKDLTLEVFEEICSTQTSKITPIGGSSFKLTCAMLLQDVQRLVNFARARVRPSPFVSLRAPIGTMKPSMPIRPAGRSPFSRNKKESDCNYEKCVELSSPIILIHTRLATHNVRSLAAVVATANVGGRSQRP